MRGRYVIGKVKKEEEDVGNWKLTGSIIDTKYLTMLFNFFKWCIPYFLDVLFHCILLRPFFYNSSCTPNNNNRTPHPNESRQLINPGFC